MKLLLPLACLLSVAASAVPDGEPRIMTKIDAIKADGDFSREKCETLRGYLALDASVAVRAHAAQVFYLLFYDLRGREGEAEAYLLEPAVRAEFNRALSANEPQTEVARAFAQTGQVMLNSLPPSVKDRLVAVYAPIFLRGLRVGAPEQRHEVLVALEAFSVTRAFKEAGAVPSLEEAAAYERDAGVRESILELLTALRAAAVNQAVPSWSKAKKGEE